MATLGDLPLSIVRLPPNHPRKRPDAEVVTAMATSLKSIGQQVPCLGYREGDMVELIDGGTRLLAALEAGLPTIKCVVLEERPTPAQEALARLSIDYHSHRHKPSQRSSMLGGAIRTTGLSLTEVCDKSGISQSYGSKLMSLAKLAPEVLARVDEGALSVERAYSLSQEPDHARQVALLVDAATLSREALRKRVRNGAAAEPKASAVKLPMPGAVVSLRGNDLTLERCIAALKATVKRLSKALSDGIDVSTVERVFADTARAK